MKKLLPVFIIFIFLVLGCTSFETVESAKVAPSEIVQNYRISSAQNRTSVTAIFYAGGATVDLDAPTRIELNGKEMSESKPFFMKGTDYHYNSGSFEPTFQFAFYTADGKIFRNEISLAPIEIAGRDLSLSRSREIRIQLSRAVAPNESVSFSLRSQTIEVVSNETGANNFNADSQTTKERYSADGGAHLDAARASFAIEPSQLEKFALGKAILRIEVSKDADLQESTGKGGRMYSSYESQDVEVNIVK